LGVCLEQSRGPVLYALLKYDFLALYPVNPRALADFRRAFAVSGAKDDPGDADLLGEMGEKHHQRLRPLAVEDQATRQLRLLVEGRRTVVEDRTGLVNRLGATLKCYYPLALDLVGEDLAAPEPVDPLEDWIRLPAGENDLRVRVSTLLARAGEVVAGPVVDDDGLTVLLELPAIGSGGTAAQIDASVAEQVVG
jgi:hypothetical protein